jgi:hypothetical protein
MPRFSRFSTFYDKKKYKSVKDIRGLAPLNIIEINPKDIRSDILYDYHFSTLTDLQKEALKLLIEKIKIPNVSYERRMRIIDKFHNDYIIEPYKRSEKMALDASRIAEAAIRAGKEYNSRLTRSSRQPKSLAQTRMTQHDIDTMSRLRQDLDDLGRGRGRTQKNKGCRRTCRKICRGVCRGLCRGKGRRTKRWRL